MSNGNHALTCSKIKSRHSRHRQANDIIKHALVSVDYPSCLEPNALCVSTAKRPDGITLLPYIRGKPLVWDFTCSHRLAATYASVAIQEDTKVAELAEARKYRTYDELSRNYIVQPVAIETPGGVGPDSLSFVSELGKRITGVSGSPLETSYLRQRLGIAVQRGNAACILENLSTDF